MSTLKKEVKHEKKEHAHKEETKVARREKVAKPVFKDGNLKQKENTKEVLSAWDEMLVAKCHPGMFNSPYVAGMNCTNLPTTTFSVGGAIEGAWSSQGAGLSLGANSYTLIMWCPSMTAFSGGGSPYIPQSDRLGGLAIVQFRESEKDEPWVSRNFFQLPTSGLTMKEVYGSDLTGFSAGGFVWASEVTMNILTPAANLVGSFYKGTLAFGSLPSGGGANGSGGSLGGLTLNQLIEISGKAEVMKP